jgi:cytochrome d ubiquinol oxidase subunit I
MVGAGVAMALLAVVGLFFSYTNRMGQFKWFLRLLIAAILLPYLANSTGWLLTEVGRQPWIVQGLMTIDQAVSPNVTPAMLWITLIGFTLIYGALMVADIYLLQKFARDIGHEDPQSELSSAAQGKNQAPLKSTY